MCQIIGQEKKKKKRRRIILVLTVCVCVRVFVCLHLGDKKRNVRENDSSAQ